AEVFDRPQHAYTRHLLSAEPKGRPAPSDPDAPEILRLDDVKVHFPIKRGVLRRTVGYVKAVDGVSLALREGHTIGLVGESGSGPPASTIARSSRRWSRSASIRRRASAIRMNSPAASASALRLRARWC